MQRLARNFVPAADEVYRLQKGEGAECDLFRRIAEQGHYAGRTQPSDTRQGIYVATTDGRLLASVNSNNPRRVEEMLLTALRRLEAIDASDPAAEPADAAPLNRRWEHLAPSDGLILRVVSRDLPRDEPEVQRPNDRRRRWRGWHRQAWNLDYAWFRRAEMLSLLPRRHRVGATTTVPRRLVERLARLHLVDNVRGQVDAFARDDLKQTELRSRITEVRGDRVELVLEGRTRAVHPRTAPAEEQIDRRRRPDLFERGIETTMLGTAEFDTRLNRFVRFDLVALGTRWGGTRHNARERDLEANGIGYAFTLAKDDAPVAPAYVWQYGWE